MGEKCLKVSQMDEKLKEEGWVRQFTASEPRLSEALNLYKSLGFEVHLEPVKPSQFDEECRACIEGEMGRCKTIYTRRKTEG